MKVVQTPAVSHNTAIMATFLGCDLRTILPPFAPVGRNSEGIFQTIITKCQPDSYFGHLPFAALHIGSGTGKYFCDLDESARSIRLCDVMTACIAFSEFEPHDYDAGESLRELGEFLIHLGSTDAKQFDERVRGYLTSLLEAQSLLWRGVLSAFGSKPQFWSSDVHRYIDARAFAIESSKYIAACDFHAVDPETSATTTRMFVERYGQLLYWWPEIVKAAREYRQKGHLLACSL